MAFSLESFKLTFVFLLLPGPVELGDASSLRCQTYVADFGTNVYLLL